MLDDQRRATALLDQDRAKKMLADRQTLEDVVARAEDHAKTQQAVVDEARRLLRQKDTLDAPKADMRPRPSRIASRSSSSGEVLPISRPSSPGTAANSYILDLTMRLIDLRSDIDAARVRVAHADTLAKQGAAGTEEQELAVIELRRRSASCLQSCV
jgi:hypothetical protein